MVTIFYHFLKSFCPPDAVAVLLAYSIMEIAPRSPPLISFICSSSTNPRPDDRHEDDDEEDDGDDSDDGGSGGLRSN